MTDRQLKDDLRVTKFCKTNRPRNKILMVRSSSSLFLTTPPSVLAGLVIMTKQNIACSEAVRAISSSNANCQQSQRNESIRSR